MFSELPCDMFTEATWVANIHLHGKFNIRHKQRRQKVQESSPNEVLVKPDKL
jgi:hypothetical protein